MMSPVESTKVVIIGALTTAGSTPTRCAVNGRIAPAAAEMMQMVIRERDKTIAIFGSKIAETGKTAIMPSISPRRIPTRSSRKMTLKKSRNWTSLTAMALTIRVADCDPMFPPVSVSSEYPNKIEVNQFQGRHDLKTILEF
jgi:hypothetical protein